MFGNFDKEYQMELLKKAEREKGREEGREEGLKETLIIAPL